MTDPRLKETLGILETLVAFDTTSALSNLPFIDFIAARLQGQGIDARRQTDKEGRKANLLATIGPAREGGVVLSGHTDVVPVANQAWTRPPFRLTREGERLYGRGTTDMKSFIAAALAMAPVFRDRGLRVPIHLALSYDEEVGCFGAHPLVALIGREVPRPAMAIVGEPSFMRVVNRHKGVYGFEAVIKGRAAHSSRPDLGANAIAASGELVAFLNTLTAELGVRAHPGARDFHPPHSTVNLGRIDGGTAINIVANECRLVWEQRLVPEDSAAELRRRVDDFVRDRLAPLLGDNAPEGAIRIDALFVVPPLAPEPGSAAEKLALDITGGNRTFAVPFGSEAGIFQGAGIPTVICGPGEIAQAHQPDEFIVEDQIRQCLEFLDRLGDWAAR